MIPISMFNMCLSQLLQIDGYYFDAEMGYLVLAFNCRMLLIKIFLYCILTSAVHAISLPL